MLKPSKDAVLKQGKDVVLPFSDMVRGLVAEAPRLSGHRAQGHPRPFGTSTQNALAEALSETTLDVRSPSFGPLLCLALCV